MPQLRPQFTQREHLSPETLRGDGTTWQNLCSGAPGPLGEGRWGGGRTASIKTSVWSLTTLGGPGCLILLHPLINYCIYNVTYVTFPHLKSHLSIAN